MKKRILSIAISLAMVMAFMPMCTTGAFAKILANKLVVTGFQGPESGKGVNENIDKNMNNLKAELFANYHEGSVGTATITGIEWRYVNGEKDVKVGSSSTFKQTKGYYYAKIKMTFGAGFDETTGVTINGEEKRVNRKDTFSEYDQDQYIEKCTVVTAPMSKSGELLTITCDQGYSVKNPQFALLDDVKTTGELSADFTVVPIRVVTEAAAGLMVIKEGTSGESEEDIEYFKRITNITTEETAFGYKYKVSLSKNDVTALMNGTLKDDSGKTIPARADYILYFGIFERIPENIITEKSTENYACPVFIQKSISVSGLKWNYSAAKTYTGKAQTVKLSSVPSGVTAKYTGNKKTLVGTYTAKVSFTANDPMYNVVKGSVKSLTWKINPAKATVYKATPGTKKLTVKMYKTASSYGGKYFQIKYRVKGSSKWSTVTTAKQSRVIKNLKKGKVYQVKARAYKTVNGKTYYGAWSKVKTSKKVK